MLIGPQNLPENLRRVRERIAAAAGQAGRPVDSVTLLAAAKSQSAEAVRALAALGEDDRAFKQDVCHLLFDEARVLDGDRPADAKMFCDRLARLVRRGLAAKDSEGKPAD